MTRLESTVASVFLIGIYFVALAIATKRRGRNFSGPWFFLLRSFLPNWRFYHDVGQQPRIFFRYQAPNLSWSQWEMFDPRSRFSALTLFFNAKNNLRLAEQNLVDHLSADLQAGPGELDKNLVSFRLVDRLVRNLVWNEARAARVIPLFYQFELRLFSQANHTSRSDLIMTTPEFPWI